MARLPLPATVAILSSERICTTKKCAKVQKKIGICKLFLLFLLKKNNFAIKVAVKAPKYATKG